jgi:hypothetical protein
MTTIPVFGQKDIIYHTKGTKFERTFNIFEKNTDTGVETPFTLIGFTGVFQILDFAGGEVLYEADSDESASPPLTLNTTSFTLEDFIDVEEGKWFFQLIITETADAENILQPYYGTWNSVIK